MNMFLFLLGRHLRMVLINCVVTLFFCSFFLKNCQAVFQRDSVILHSQQQCMKFLISPSLHLLSYFLIIAILLGAKLYLISFDLHFPDKCWGLTCWCWGSSHMHIGHLYFSEYLFRMLLLFNWVFCLFIKLQEFFLYSGIFWIEVSHQKYELLYFIPFSGLSLYFLDGMSRGIEIFNFFLIQ